MSWWHIGDEVSLEKIAFGIVQPGCAEFFRNPPNAVLRVLISKGTRQGIQLRMLLSPTPDFAAPHMAAPI